MRTSQQAVSITFKIEDANNQTVATCRRNLIRKKKQKRKKKKKKKNALTVLGAGNHGEPQCLE